LGDGRAVVKVTSVEPARKARMLMMENMIAVVVLIFGSIVVVVEKL
jgi:hypothetical protein